MRQEERTETTELAARPTFCFFGVARKLRRPAAAAAIQRGRAAVRRLYLEARLEGERTEDKGKVHQSER